MTPALERYVDELESWLQTLWQFPDDQAKPIEPALFAYAYDVAKLPEVDTGDILSARNTRYIEVDKLNPKQFAELPLGRLETLKLLVDSMAAELNDYPPKED